MKLMLARLNPRVLLAIAMCMVVSALCGLSYPWLLRRILDNARQHGTDALIFLATLSLQAACNYWAAVAMQRANERLARGLRQDLFGHLCRLDGAFYADRQSADLAAAVTADTDIIRQWFLQSLLLLLRASIVVCGSLAMMLWLAPGPSVSMFAALLCWWLLARQLGRKVRLSMAAAQNAAARGTAHLQQRIAAMREVQAYARERHEQHLYERILDESSHTAIDAARWQGLLSVLSELSARAAMLFALWWSAYLVDAGTLSVSMLASLLLYCLLLADALTVAARLWGDLQQAMGAASRLEHLLAQAPLVHDPDRADSPAISNGEVAFRDVHFSYPGLDVLRGVSFLMHPKERVALVGASGVGKTTLASLLCRHWDPQRGTVTLDGVDLHQLPLHYLRRAIGLVAQEPVLFDGTVFDNIAYGREEATPEEVRWAAEQAAADDFIERLPNGFQTTVGEGGARLSRGQRQRIVLARMWLRNPAVLVLDEATNSLEEPAVGPAIERLMQDRTCLVITHRPRDLRGMDRVLLLEAGEIIHAPEPLPANL